MIAVDVDGTLKLSSGPNAELIAWCRKKKSEGFRLMLWSTQGEEYAREYARSAECEDAFDIICSKPGYIVDDKGWAWTRFTKPIRIGF